MQKKFDVMKNKYPMSISFPFYYTILMSSSLWAFYAYIIGDYFIFVSI